MSMAGERSPCGMAGDVPGDAGMAGAAPHRLEAPRGRASRHRPWAPPPPAPPPPTSRSDGRDLIGALTPP